MNNTKSTSKDIVRIIIISSSGYGPMEEALKESGGKLPERMQKEGSHVEDKR